MVFIVLHVLRFYGLCDDYMLCLALALTCAVTQTMYYVLLCNQSPFSHTYLDSKILELHEMTHLSLTAVEVKPYLVGMGRASQLGPSSLEPPDESLFHCIMQERLEENLTETQGAGKGVLLSISEQQEEPQTPYLPEDSYKDDDFPQPAETQDCSLSSTPGLRVHNFNYFNDRAQRPEGSIAEKVREGQNYDHTQEEDEEQEMAYAS